MRVTRRQLRRILQEAVSLDIEKGDVILTGKFKNKRTVVKDFGTDDLGQPTINGMKALKFRIEKLMPEEKWSKKTRQEAGLEEGKTMRISKRQLRRIVREEKRRILEDCGDAPPIEPGGVGLEPALTKEPAPELGPDPLLESEAPLGDLIVEMEVAARALDQVVEAVQNAAHLCPDCGDQVAMQAPLMEAMVHQAEALAENLEAQVAVIAESALPGVSAGEAIDFTGDVAELPGDEAFGLGYIAGSQGLE